MPNGTTVALNPDMMLLRGSSLRNCEWVYGICVYSGHDSKVMMNSAKSKVKKSKIEIATNTYILVTILIEVVLCLFAALYTSLWQKWFGSRFKYMDFETSHWLIQTGVQTGTWFLLLMNFVSISLLVTLEMVKFIQA